MPSFYSAPMVGLTLKIIESYGIDPLPLLEKNLIDPQLIKDPNARFAFNKIDNLWFDAVKLSEDSCFGLRAARFWHPSYLGALGYAWLSSYSIRSALERFARYLKIVTDGVILTIEERDNDFSVLFSYQYTTDSLPYRSDSTMAILLAMCKANCGNDFRPSSLSLCHSKPAKSSEFYELFACAIEFSAEENRFNISKEVANQHLSTSNPQLNLINDQLIIKTLAKIEKSNIIAQVEAEILEQLTTGNTSDKSVANKLNLSLRGLQRKLQQDSTTFKQIYNSIRLELAKKYLKDNDLNLIDIAFNIGFSEYSSFSRAFKTWTGYSPSEFRKKQ